VGGVVAALLLLVGVVVVATNDTGTPPAAATGPAGGNLTLPSAQSFTPPQQAGDEIRAMLQIQADALIRGDETTWLAAAGPSVRAFFQKRYALLRQLGISQFAYEFSNYPVEGPDSVTADVLSGYCFSLPSCPKVVGFANSPVGAPTIRESFTFRKNNGRWVIDKVYAAGGDPTLEPAPWQDGNLVVAQGKRVIVATTPNNAGRLAEAVRAGDQAATTVDKFAAQFDNPQGKYRIYLADEKHWKIWFSLGEEVAGYELPLRGVQSEIVVRLKYASPYKEFQNTIQHEMGHVASVGSISPDGRPPLNNKPQWLTEGLAEYIAYYPKGPQSSARLSRVRELVHSSASPRSMTAGTLGGTLKEDNQFYGYVHYSVYCMAQQYGEAKMIQFADLMLRKGRPEDEASQQAFGKPFDDVDSGCVRWIKTKV
jgi:hypothetical protein